MADVTYVLRMRALVTWTYQILATIFSRSCTVRYQQKSEDGPCTTVIAWSSGKIFARIEAFKNFRMEAEVTWLG